MDMTWEGESSSDALRTWDRREIEACDGGAEWNSPASRTTGSRGGGPPTPPESSRRGHRPTMISRKTVRSRCGLVQLLCQRPDAPDNLRHQLDVRRGCGIWCWCWPPGVSFLGVMMRAVVRASARLSVWASHGRRVGRRIVHQGWIAARA